MVVALKILCTCTYMHNIMYRQWKLAVIITCIDRWSPYTYRWSL